MCVRERREREREGERRERERREMREERSDVLVEEVLKSRFQF